MNLSWKPSTPDVPRWVMAIAISLFVLQLADSATTLYLVGLSGVGVEQNPVMRWLIGVSPLLFGLLKMFAAVFCAWWPPWAWQHSRSRVARLVLGLFLLGLFAEYAFVVISNLVWCVIATRLAGL